VLFVTFQYLQERITGPAALIVEAGDLLEEVVSREKENAVQSS
jgi:HAE1 family hydrophobic/amphiphilic exporter-1